MLLYQRLKTENSQLQKKLKSGNFEKEGLHRSPTERDVQKK